ncbi:hypothetical protein ES705_31043 [subsurface metagenome]
MELECIMAKLGEVEDRVICIETDMKWIKNLMKWLLIGVLGMFGIQIPVFL